MYAATKELSTKRTKAVDNKEHLHVATELPSVSCFVICFYACVMANVLFTAAHSKFKFQQEILANCNDATIKMEMSNKWIQVSYLGICFALDESLFD